MSAGSAAVAHFDVAGDDLGRLAGFYRSVFAWTVEPRGPGYALVTTPELRGALVEAPTPSLTLGIAVDDLDAVLSTIEAAGGRVEMPPTDNGWVRKATVRDPAGNALTLIER